jgi:hypothetical protein
MVSRVSPYMPGGQRIMATDGGAHPPDVWAQVTAEQIAPVLPDMSGTQRKQALALQLKIADVLEPHHKRVQDDEKVKLTADTAHIMAPPDPTAYLAKAVADVVAAAVGSPWEANFQKPELQDLIGREIGSHFATAQHIEKSWHADRNPMHPAAIEFRTQHHPAPVGA